jgi:hypothetical protein
MGDTIAGLIVDGQPWPDVRLLMIDAEELTLNAHAMRHPRWAHDASAVCADPYKLRQTQPAALQELISAKGIDFIELNPHRDITGRTMTASTPMAVTLAWRRTAEGECFSAAMVEQDWPMSIFIRMAGILFQSWR